ncbi:hypothetical protein DERP_008022 [Dermatophagoides pteronyssinus]|uniref:adenylate cyclase n=1 Tax=Dermatophagoides pteronyssinus TaxID=6956 RepID=A0ABQ8ITC5_DERPT|nr:hypothetical protein DERP_008022 [Dermatophagoides pteronyssinus]
MFLAEYGTFFWYFISTSSSSSTSKSTSTSTLNKLSTINLSKTFTNQNDHNDNDDQMNTMNTIRLLSSWKTTRPIFFLIFCNEILLPFPKRLYSITSGLVAFYVTYLLEIVNRRAFLDHRKCVESKYKLTFERDEQERLLASCLPKHLMKKVRNDIRSRFTGNWSSSISSNRSMINNNNTVINVDGNNNNDNDEHRNQIHSTKSNIDHPHHHHHHHKSGSNGSIGRPFSEMYIDKYSNVTILYADIVNSMALTQTLQSPKALVEALNNLFCRFDCRAENHDCLRIKLLGDCYYCISGIPDDEDKRHAANCLRMGLDMLDIIKEYRHETGINVDMRIGIHTGMILSGLLGLKKWQFDIWSIDTMKASQMEQEGRPGFVHITMASLQQIPADILNNLLIIENHNWSRQDSSRRRPMSEVINSLRNYGEMIRCSNDSLSQTIDKIFFFTERGNWFCYMAIIVAIVSLIYTLTKHNHHHNHHNHNNQQRQKRQNQMICIEFRMLIWLLISTLLITSTIMDMSHCSMAQMQEIKIHQHNDNRTINTIGKECLYKWSRYYTYSSILAMSSISLFIRVNLWFKFALSTVALSTISLIIHLHPCSIFLRIDRFYQLPRNEHYDQQQQQTLFEKNQQQFFGDLLTPTMSHLHYLFIVYLMFHVLDRQIEYISRLDFLWAHKLKRERREARLMREVNQLLLKNILPIHVAQKFLTNPEQANSLYYEPYDSCAVMFAAIPNFFRFYTETKDNDDGLQYLYILNDIICEFDKLLILPQFKRRIEKIKTIGSTYMAAAGLQPGRASIDSSITTKQEVTNLVIMIRFALSMMRVLNRLNSIPRDEQTVNQCLTADQHFQLRIGISMGPVIAGVVGAIKPQYDIWGDTVNVASRMDTYGVVNKIQIPDYVAKVLIDHQLFRPYSRGIQEVKGKGKLETFLIDYNEHDCME